MDQKQIGTFIAELRKDKKLTQAELGNKLGVTNKTVSRWENGNYMPDISVIPQLCRALDISVNELFSGMHLDENNFKASADKNLVSSLQQIKYIRKQKRIIDFFGGTGTGMLISALYSPESYRKIIVIVLAICMILVSWYLRNRYDKYIIKALGYDND